MSRRLCYIITILFFSYVHLYSAADKDNYSSSSLLSLGQWFKIAIVEDGIYRIDYNDLAALGVVNPQKPRIFGNNNGQLSFYNDGSSSDDIKEIAIFMEKGIDNIFNEGDYLLFYAEGVNRWIFNYNTGDYEYKRHHYADTAYYFITSGIGQGKEIINERDTIIVTNKVSNSSDFLFIHEKEDVNLLHSGREWFEEVNANNPLAIRPFSREIITSEPVKYHIRVAGRSSNRVRFNFLESSNIITEIVTGSVNLSNYNGTYAQLADSSGTFMVSSVEQDLIVSLTNNNSTSNRGWLDYITLQGRRSNRYNGGLIIYRDSKVIGSGNNTLFSIEAPAARPIIWDITNPVTPFIVSQTVTGDNISFSSSTDSLKTFIAFTPTDVLRPLIINSLIPPQNLHASESADMIIVSHPLFKEHALELARMHHAHDGLISIVVSPEEIYNEFSGGTPDISAIRNFVRMKYLRQLDTDSPLKYLLLFGDGSFDNKTSARNRTNFIPTFQSKNSNTVVSSFSSDDFFTLLEDGEGEAAGTEDIGVGRLPVTDTTEAGIIVRKIAKYMLATNKGDWKNTISIVADDEDNNIHLFDAEDLSLKLANRHPQYKINKIYLDAYKQSSETSGQSYPEVVADINKQMNDGCLIFNYVGHGNENGLAAERVLRTEDIATWTNEEKLPLFITATCEFSRFDDVSINAINNMRSEKKSAGEKILLNENGGSIALMSTTRVAFSSSNHLLNKNIYDFAFQKDDKGRPICLGDIMRLSKLYAGSDINKRNFALLGDPALRLAYPYQGFVITDSINSISVHHQTDTLKALSEITISGHVESITGQLSENFNGTVNATIYDKPITVKTLANDGGSSAEFQVQENIIYKGSTTAKNGRFEFTFIVPRDINYSVGKGKIRYYAFDKDIDMNGSFSDFMVGGFSETLKVDNDGPMISLFINDSLFRDGGIINNRANLLALLEDPSGINNAGYAIGHDITLTIDGGEPISINSYFINNQDTFTKGSILFPLINLTEGEHEITVKAWDNYNNSSQSSITFVVSTTEEFLLNNILVYPNPAREELFFTTGHNHPGDLMEIEIRIFDISGRVIKIIRTNSSSGGYQLPAIRWDCKNDNGQRVSGGIYLFRITIRTNDGQQATEAGRIVVLQ